VRRATKDFEPIAGAETERATLRLSKPRGCAVRLLGLPEPLDLDAEFTRCLIARLVERLRRE
jgi:hypothetical protein